MRSLLATLTTLVLLSPAALAASTWMTPLTDFTEMSEEYTPSTAGDDFQYRTRYGPTSYPADATNVKAAMDQLDGNGASPVLVLNQKTSFAGVADPVLDIMAVNTVYGAATGKDYTGPWYQAIALYGMWSDLNEDGFIQNDQWDDDPDGDVFFTAGVAGRAKGTAANDEWDGITSTEYKEGGDHSERELVIYNTGYGYRWSGQYEPGTQDTRDLELFPLFGSDHDGWDPMETFDPITENDGYHKTKIILGFDEGNYDQNLIVTNIWETYLGALVLESLAGCDLTVDGCRQYDPVDTTLDANGNKKQPYDVDIYESTDPALQSLYATNVLPVYRNAVETGNTTSSAVDTQVEAVEAIIDDTVPDVGALDDLDATTTQTQGQVDDVIFPSIYEGPLAPDGFGSNSFDYTAGWHPYLDISVQSGCYAPLPAFIIFGACGWGAQGVTMKPGTDNYGVAPGTMFVFAQFGLWFDEDANGFITDHEGSNEDVANGCDDLRDCGNDDDPNEFPLGTDGTVEYKPVCSDFIVRLTPQTTGQVWPRGAYLMGDGDAAGNDHTRPAINDVTDDNDVDRLVDDGPIDIRMTCDSADPSEHFPDTFVLLPAGNADFDVLATANILQGGGNTGVCVTHNNGVIGAGGQKECTHDSELYESWAV
ncbi:MAG TPA: hypothetical protein VI997_03540 [Candidatus Thermoplasmatota archaeon]|nr:hypothetical protein [Candidatus Thermoplasmatota archaeon]